MDIREQIGALRRQAERFEHHQREYQAMSIIDDAADTMEKLLAVYEAAIELSNELQGWQDVELAEVGGWTNTKCLTNKHQLMLDAIETLS